MTDTHRDAKKLEFDYITDGIYVGTNACCRAHFDEKLADEGITEDISLEDKKIDTPFGVESYLWIPVKDKTPPNPDQMEYGISALEKLVSLGKKVYVHCKNGHGRSPTLVAEAFKTKGCPLKSSRATAFPSKSSKVNPRTLFANSSPVSCCSRLIASGDTLLFPLKMKNIPTEARIIIPIIITALFMNMLENHY